RGVAEEDQRAVAERGALGEAYVVEPGAVLAAEVLDLVAAAAGGGDDPGVGAGDEAVGEDQHVAPGARRLGRAAADQQLVADELQAGPGGEAGAVAAADHQQDGAVAQLAVGERRLDGGERLVS